MRYILSGLRIHRHNNNNCKCIRNIIGVMLVAPAIRRSSNDCKCLCLLMNSLTHAFAYNIRTYVVVASSGNEQQRQQTSSHSSHRPPHGNAVVAFGIRCRKRTRCANICTTILRARASHARIVTNVKHVLFGCMSCGVCADLGIRTYMYACCECMLVCCMRAQDYLYGAQHHPIPAT